MKNRVRKSWWIICCLLWTGLAFSAVLPPKLQVPNSDYDFGEVDEGSKIAHTYIVRNIGQSTLEIKDVQPG